MNGPSFNILRYGGPTDAGLRGAYAAACAGYGGTVVVDAPCVVYDTPLWDNQTRRVDLRVEPGASLTLANGNRPLLSVQTGVNPAIGPRISGGGVAWDISRVAGGSGVLVTDSVHVHLDDIQVECAWQPGSVAYDWQAGNTGGFCESPRMTRCRAVRPWGGVRFDTNQSERVAGFSQSRLDGVEVDQPLSFGFQLGAPGHKVNLGRADWHNCIVWMDDSVSGPVQGSRAAFRVCASLNRSVMRWAMESAAHGRVRGLYTVDIVDDPWTDLANSTTHYAPTDPDDGWDDDGRAVLRGIHNPGDKPFQFQLEPNVSVIWPYASQDLLCFQAPDGTPLYRVRRGADGSVVATAAQVPQIVLPGGTIVTAGAGSPEGVVAAGVGSRYIDYDDDDLYHKQRGNGSTGWVTP